MDSEAFQRLPTAEVARLVREAGSTVCAFPINGTRRWFILEHPGRTAPEDYLSITWRQHIEIYKLCFDHGLDTLLTPIFGPELLERRDNYLQLVEPGLLWLARDPAMLEFYEAYDVRVRIYGDTRRYFENTPYAPVLEAYRAVTLQTASHRTRRLFFGVCAHDPAETVAEIAVRHYREHGVVPDRRQIVEAYYGEYVEPVALFIGFDRPAVFDIPLVATGREDLYFTVSPSLYVEASTLRHILYDHLYARRVSESYGQLSAAEWAAMSEFYARNRRSVLGIGRQDASGCIWYPLSEITVPPDLNRGRVADT